MVLLSAHNICCALLHKALLTSFLRRMKKKTVEIESAGHVCVYMGVVVSYREISFNCNRFSHVFWMLEGAVASRVGVF